ncbi:MAG: acyl carrier protein [Cyanobacteria bacterium P01_H01_bin.26]
MQQLQNSSSSSTTSPALAIQQWLISQLAEVLSIDPATIEAQQPLTRYGLDSIDAVTLVGDLEDWLDLELPATLLWDYPTVEQASNYLVEEFNVSV